MQARHIFLASLTHDDTAAREKLVAARKALNEGRTSFAQLAKSISEDDASNAKGGELGWLTSRRLPQWLGDELFKLPLYHPTILKSAIGWHLIEVTDRKSAAPRSFEEAREEVIAALKAVKRREAVPKFREALRAYERERITVFRDMME